MMARKKTQVTSDAILTRMVGVRLEQKLYDELEEEMKEQGITRISNYLRSIIEKRKSRYKPREADTATISDRIKTLGSLYTTALKELAKIQRMKNPDGSYVYKPEEINGIATKLSTSTAELAKEVKKLQQTTNGNKNPQ